jgi:3-hydroxyacyl-CoA dehydrogenase/enoyl-CoA hydratase/3-hydroxybutyryl-CoA epimerase
MEEIRTVCVIGSGVMGSGIAAQVANSKTNVILLDIAATAGDKNQIVQTAYDKLFTTKPPLLSHPLYAKYIKIGNLEDDIGLINEADLLIEVIVEKLEIKHKLYESIAKYLKPGAILASNTSTLPLARLREKLPPNIRKNFVITHFFNPPRYMELVELVTDEETSRTIIPKLSNFITKFLGKTIVNCNDTPGFIANRIGCFLLELVVRKAIKEGLDPQKIDDIFSKDFGFPSTGIFGLYDLIGHDVMDLISKSLLQALPSSDKYHEIYIPAPLLDAMRAKGAIGRKAGAGFYKMVKDESGKSVKQVIDLSWRGNEETVTIQDKYKKVLDGHVVLQAPRHDDLAENQFIQQALHQFFSYVKSLIPEVTTKPEDIDKAMKLGYSLKYGPFELMERVGTKNDIARGQSDRGNLVTKTGRLDKEITTLPMVARNDAHPYYIFTIGTKMNVLTLEVFNRMIEAVNYCEDKNLPMYILPEGNNFSAGADLRYLKELIESKNYKDLEEYLALGQRAMMSLKYAKIPIIACAKGAALGGGCEILLHSHHVIAHQNLNAGLVELGLGLIAAFGGTKEMFMRSWGDKTKLLRNLRNILTQNKSNSADYFAEDYEVDCTVCMHKDLLLEEGMEVSDVIPAQAGISANLFSDPRLRGDDKEGSGGDKKSPQDDVFFSFNDLSFAIPKPDALQLDIINFFQKIIARKAITEQQLLDLEREKFLELAFKPLALEKIVKLVK